MVITIKKPHWTTLIIIDSQAVKNTSNASVESKGFCFYKATNGIKTIRNGLLCKTLKANAPLRCFHAQRAVRNTRQGREASYAIMSCNGDLTPT